MSTFHCFSVAVWCSVPGSDCTDFWRRRCNKCICYNCISGNNCIIQMANSVLIASRGFVPEKLTHELISQFLNIDEIRDKNLFLTFEVAEICGDLKV